MRGDIHHLKAANTAKGHEQQGARFAVVLQSDYLPLSTLMVAPTSTRCAPTSFRPVIDIAGTQIRVMVEQASAVDAGVRLGPMVGRLSLAEMQQVDAAITEVFGLI